METQFYKKKKQYRDTASDKNSAPTTHQLTYIIN